MKHTVTEDFGIRKTEGGRYSIDAYILGRLVEKSIIRGLKIDRPEQDIQDALMRAALNYELNRFNVLKYLLKELGIEEGEVKEDLGLLEI